MRTLAASVVVTTWILAVGAPVASAQGSEPPETASGIGRPRVEFGTAVGALAWPNSLEGAQPTLGARAGVALSRSWSLEGEVDVETGGLAEKSLRGVYHVQARWRFYNGAGMGGVETFATAGAAGTFSHGSQPEYRWTDGKGVPHIYPAYTYTNVGAPMYPTIGVGFQKTLGSHIAVRGDLAVGAGVSDYGVNFTFHPSIGVSIPIGRYAPSAR